jgi:hypothetical protein
MKKRKRGRPPINPGERAVTVSVSLSPREFRAWRKAARVRDVSLSRFVRDAVNEYPS